jgi:hypothetical protein
VKLTGSIGAADNLTFFTLIFLIALVSYLVLRSRKIDLFFAAAGALSFTFLPSLFFRNDLHVMLSAYCFIPLSILLCIWLYEDDNFLCRQKKSSLMSEPAAAPKRAAKAPAVPSVSKRSAGAAPKSPR